MEESKYQLQEIEEAVDYQRAAPIAEVFKLFNFDPNSEDQEHLINQLLLVSTNPKLVLLPKPERLAIIKACQEYVGRLFQRALLGL